MTRITALSIEWTLPQNLAELKKLGTLCMLSIGSYLTDPACAVDQYITSFFAVDDLPACPFLKKKIDNSFTYARPFTAIDLNRIDTSYVTKLVHKVFLSAGILTSIVFAPLGIGGIFCRHLAKWIDRDSWIVLKGVIAAKDLQDDHQFTISTANYCAIEGGYALKEGGVIPIVEWPTSCRLEKIIEHIQSRQSDVLCLNEIFNVNHARYIAYRLKDTYANFIFGCGNHEIGPGSGLFVASKFDIEKVEFQPFTKDQLTGTAVNSGKGILEVDFKDSKGSISSVYALHLNHSEEPERPTEADKKARKIEMDLVLDKISQKGDRNVVVVGDLNMDDREIEEITLKFIKQKEYIDLSGNPDYTWGGDKWYVEFSNRASLFEVFFRSIGLIQKEVSVEKRKPSGPTNLDHIMVYKRQDPASTPRLIETHLENTGYVAEQISLQALSDHRPVSSTIQITSRK